jgi:hypothetical protein
MSVSEVFRRIKSALDSAGIGYMLSGSFASAYYGAARSTQDIDLVIAATPAQLRAFVEVLSSDKYYVDLDAALEAHRHQSLFNVIDLATGWTIFVATAEDVVIAKLEWSKLAQSRRQIEDVAAILRMRWESLDNSYLEKWIAELGLNKEWKDARIAASLSDPT